VKPIRSQPQKRIKEFGFHTKHSKARGGNKKETSSSQKDVTDTSGMMGKKKLGVGEGKRKKQLTEYMIKTWGGIEKRDNEGGVILKGSPEILSSMK